MERLYLDTPPATFADKARFALWGLLFAAAHFWLLSGLNFPGWKLLELEYICMCIEWERPKTNLPPVTDTFAVSPGSSALDVHMVPYRNDVFGLSVPLDAFVHFPTRAEAKALYKGALPQWDTEITIVCEAASTGRVKDCVATQPEARLAAATETLFERHAILKSRPELSPPNRLRMVYEWDPKARRTSAPLDNSTFVD